MVPVLLSLFYSKFCMYKSRVHYIIKVIGAIVIIVMMSPGKSYGQDTDSGPGFQILVMNNPAFTGSEGDGVLRLSYYNYYPGNNYNLNSVFLSYDSYFSELHGGAGIYLSDNYLGGIINELRGGLSYSYFLQAGKDLFINAGLSASFYHKGFKFDGAVLPDQIDPLGGVLFPSADILTNSGKTVFDIGAGFMFISGRFFGGFSINHLAEPDLSTTGFLNEKLRRKVLIHLSADVNVNKTQSLKVRPLAYLVLQGNYLSVGSGAVLESKYLAVNSIVMGDTGNNINIQTGLTFTRGNVSLYYNYRFNIISGNILMPLSLLHQTGLAFSLNNVDKRNTFKTINFPKL